MNIKWGASFIFFLFVLSYLTYSSYQNRVYDWDMPGYLGSIYSWDYPNDAEKVHSLTYSSIKEEASPEKYKDIISLNLPNKVFEKDYSAFSEQLPYYQIKVGYNALIYTVHKIGFSGPTSLFIVNFLAYFISGLLIFYFLMSLFPKYYLVAPIISISILSLPVLREMAENPTPDILSFVLLLLFIISVLQKRSAATQFILLLISVLIRPDYIIFALSYLFLAIFFRFIKENKKVDFSLIGQALIMVIVYLIIIKYYHYPGWNDVFYDTFIHRRPVISAEPANFTFKQYWDLLIFKLVNFKRISIVSSVILTAIFFVSKDLFVRMLSSLVFLNIYFKFLLFPQGGTLRFFLGFVIILFLILIYAVSTKNIKLFKLKKIS
ncbi:hypothetical protein PQ459_04390 [Chryseobacterium sp. KACC 21268]|nr:hypothetical protein PQ459_04390 [Chryseobacterium sp. KACC 21268]